MRQGISSDWAREALAVSRARLARLEELRADMAEGNRIVRYALARDPYLALLVAASIVVLSPDGPLVSP